MGCTPLPETASLDYSAPGTRWRKSAHRPRTRVHDPEDNSARTPKSSRGHSNTGRSSNHRWIRAIDLRHIPAVNRRSVGQAHRTGPDHHRSRHRPRRHIDRSRPKRRSGGYSTRHAPQVRCRRHTEDWPFDMSAPCRRRCRCCLRRRRRRHGPCRDRARHCIRRDGIGSHRRRNPWDTLSRRPQADTLHRRHRVRRASRWRSEQSTHCHRSGHRHRRQDPEPRDIRKPARQCMHHLDRCDRGDNLRRRDIGRDTEFRSGY